MNRVLEQMATPVIDGSKSVAAAPAVPQHGALIIAAGINRTCGFWSYYCIGATWILRGLDGIFGNSHTENTFKQTYDLTASEVWSRETARYKPGITVFAEGN